MHWTLVQNKAPYVYTYPDKWITGYFFLRLGVAFTCNRKHGGTYPVKFLAAYESLDPNKRISLRRFSCIHVQTRSTMNRIGGARNSQLLLIIWILTIININILILIHHSLLCCDVIFICKTKLNFLVQIFTKIRQKFLNELASVWVCNKIIENVNLTQITSWPLMNM